MSIEIFYFFAPNKIFIEVKNFQLFTKFFEKGLIFILKLDNIVNIGSRVGVLERK